MTDTTSTLTPPSDAAFPPGIRHFRPGDEEPILAASIACLERGEFEGVTRHDLEESVKRLPADPAMCAVAEEDGRVVGWVIPRHDDLTVDLPYRRRGHGTRLVAAGRAIARAHGLDKLRLWAPRHLPGPIAFLERNGFRYDSSMWLMRLGAATPVPPPAWPDDIVVRWYEHGDEAAYVELANDAFADHPSPLAFTVERVRHVHSLPGFDPSTILLVAPSGERDRLVGFVRVQRYEDDDDRPAGDIGPVGLRRGWRGRGIGRELLRWGVEDLRRRGAEDVFLSVEAANEHALRLYERNGFERHVEWPHWAIDA